jgi:diaminohydroxyphosphoribosylaminopyrimidine deaminase/5-amino-6-(5-phosphoribosylamino)uracil reductase
VVVGEGYHERKGEAHAEAQALAAAGPLADGATAVVTLEPCNHQGRTAPCRQALIDARVRRVVIGMIDPTSRGEGGAAALRAAGVDVETGVLADEARVVLGSWLAALEARRPVLTWPYMISGSGIVALPGGMEDSWRLRLNADAVLYAGGSVTEAMPGSHGAGILDVKDVPAGSAASAVLASLYEGGVRRLVLDGGLEVAAPLLAAGLVDRVLAYLADGPASRRPGVALPWPLLPPGFAITGAWRVREFVRIEGEPEKIRLKPGWDHVDPLSGCMGTVSAPFVFLARLGSCCCLVSVCGRLWFRAGLVPACAVVSARLTQLPICGSRTQIMERVRTRAAAQA